MRFQLVFVYLFIYLFIYSFFNYLLFSYLFIVIDSFAEALVPTYLLF